MRKKTFVLFLFGICLIKFSTASPDNTYPQDTTKIYLGDSISATLEIYDSIESNFEVNLDSMLNLYYVRQSIAFDTLDLADADSTIPDFPDSVYIARLAAIPITNVKSQIRFPKRDA